MNMKCGRPKTEAKNAGQEYLKAMAKIKVVVANVVVVVVVVTDYHW